MKLRLCLFLILVSCHFTISGQYNLNIKRTFSETSHQVICACYSPDGKYIITGGSDNSIIIWNAESGIIYRTLTGLKKRPNTAIISKANDLIISAGEDNIITIWNPSTSLVSFTLSGHTAPVNSLDISPDGKYLASGSSDKTIRIWDLNKKTVIYELKGHKLDVTSVKFSPDGKKLVSGGADKTVILWNMQNGNIILSKKLHSDYIRKVIYSPDGSLIASCGDDKLINISSAADLSIKTTLRGHTDWVQTIDFSPDGSQIISGGHDQLIILWDVASGKILSQSDRQGEKVISVDFCPVRPDFLSAVVRSENVNTWALPDRGLAELSAPSEKSISKPPLEERELSARKSEMIMAEKTNVASDSKSIILKESVAMDEKAFEKMEIPPEKMAITSPVINFFDPVPAGDKVSYDKKNIYLIGRVTGPDPVSSILINKNLIKLTEAGVFEINLTLTKGENPVEMIAVSSRGKMTTKNIIIDCTASDASEQGAVLPDIFSGKFYALIIGINDYKSDEITDLDNPIKDGESLSKVLTEQYAFDKENVTFLKNPTQGDIIVALEKLGRDLSQNDNLLVFYAGHGSWDERAKVGYWFPSDATKSSSVNWFSNTRLRDYLGGIQAKHIMLIADACFSGAIFKTRSAGMNAPQGINTLYDSPSRKAMTSGNLLEVPDQSIFIEYLVKKLSENKEKFLPAEILYGKIKEAVVNNSTTNPQYGTIQNVGDEGGDFIFIKK